MPTMTGGAAVIETLLAAGVDTFFGVPAGPNLGLYDALHERPAMRPIVTRHEQGAAFMADGYARAGRTMGVAVVVPGDGLTNALTPLAQARASSSRVLLISGHNAPALVHYASTWSHPLHRPEEIPAALCEAQRRMHTQRPGPVVLEINQDVLEATGAVEIPPAEWELPAGDPQRITEAARRLAKAARPLIFLGERVERGGASEELVRLAERLGAPYFTTRRGKGAVREGHPLFLGNGWDGPLPGAVSDELFGQVDVALVVEAAPTLGGAFRGEVVRVGLDPDEIAADTSSCITVTGHPQRVLSQFCAEIDTCRERTPQISDFGFRISESGKSAIRNPQFAIRSAFPPELLRAFRQEAWERDYQHEPLALDVLRLIRGALPPETIITADSLIGLWASRWLDVTVPGTFHFPNGTLGFAMPAAVGAKLARPERPVVALAGDGAFMFTASDLATAVQHRVAIKVVICNSGGYEAIRCHQQNRFGRSLATELTSPPDFARFAEAFGAEGLKLRHYEELPAALEQVLANDHVSVIDVPVAVKPM